jgi:hypothetical protein
VRDFLRAPALHPSRSPASPNHAATMVRSSSATLFSSSTNSYFLVFSDFVSMPILRA